MNLHRGFEIYNTDGKEITYQELNEEDNIDWEDEQLKEIIEKYK